MRIESEGVAPEEGPGGGFTRYIRKAVDIVLLRGAASRDAAGDAGATVPAIAVVALGGVALATGSFLGTAAVPSALAAMLLMAVAAVFTVLFSLFFVWILHSAAKLLGGSARYMELYRPVALGYIISWAYIVPVVGGVMSLWSLPVNVVVIENVHGISRWRAIGAVLITVAALLLLQALFLSLQYERVFPGDGGPAA